MIPSLPAGPPKIWVDSKEGEYCEFLFTLPAPPSSPIKGGKLKDQ